MLGLPGSYTGDLPHRRPRERSGRERGIEDRQLGQRSADAEALLGLPGLQAEDAFGVLPEARVSGPRVDAEPLGREEPSAHVSLMGGALPAEIDEGRVHARPLRSRRQVGLGRCVLELATIEKIVFPNRR